jgi:RNA polymerase sigma factor (sigma-70 family)
MSTSIREDLRRHLAERYEQLRRRLTRKLGSEALAEEALHETWVRLGRGSELAPVANQDSYLLRAAANMAASLRISEEKHMGGDPDIALEQPDDAPDAHRIAAGKAQVAMVMRALEELPDRQRDVFRAWFMADSSTEQLAQKHGVSLRTIQADLRSAVIHCARRTGRKDLLVDRNFKVSRD